MTYTIEEAKAWCEEHKVARIEASEHKDMLYSIPSLARTYMAGEWLWEKMRDMGADEEEGSNACFALGQRALFGDPFPWAVQYANEYAVATEVDPGDAIIYMFPAIK